MWFQPIAQSSVLLYLEKYKNSPLDLSTSLQSYRNSQQWEVLDNTTERINRSSEQGVVLVYSNRPALRFSLTAERRPTFKAYLLLIPSLVLPILTMVVFTMPPERPDRLSLGRKTRSSSLVNYSFNVLMFCNIARLKMNRDISIIIGFKACL